MLADNTEIFGSCVHSLSLLVAILLGHLKMPFAKIKEAVIACDENMLSEQHLRQMENFAPDDKEVTKNQSCDLHQSIKKLRTIIYF